MTSLKSNLLSGLLSFVVNHPGLFRLENIDLDEWIRYIATKNHSPTPPPQTLSNLRSFVFVSLFGGTATHPKTYKFSFKQIRLNNAQDNG